MTPIQPADETPTPTTPDEEDTAMIPETHDGQPTERIDDDTVPSAPAADPPVQAPPVAAYSAGSPATAYSAGAPAAQDAGPRVRSGAIAWGVIVIAFAALMLAVTVVPGNADAFARWAASLTPASAIVISVVAIGAFVLLVAGLSAIRRAQRSASQNRSSAGR